MSDDISADAEAAVAALAAVWRPSEAPGRTHAAWRRVGQREARGVCDALRNGSPQDRAVLTEHARRWDAHFQNFIHAETEDAVRTSSEPRLQNVVLAAGMLAGHGDPRDPHLYLAPFRRACRILGVRPRHEIKRLEPVIGADATRLLLTAAPSGLTGIGLRLFHGWRERGPRGELVFETTAGGGGTVEERRARIERSLGGVEGAWAAEARFALDPDPGPPPDGLPRPGSQPG